MIKIIHEKDRRGNFLNVLRRKYVISLQIYFRGREGFVKFKKREHLLNFQRENLQNFRGRRNYCSIIIETQYCYLRIRLELIRQELETNVDYTLMVVQMHADVRHVDLHLRQYNVPCHEN